MWSGTIKNLQAFENANQLKVKYDFGQRRDEDLLEFWANSDKVQEVLGWKLVRSLEDMCRDTWNWQR